MKKLNLIFFLITGIWLLDFISTIIALNFMDNLYETNKWFAYLFTFGFIGWMGVFCLTICGHFIFANMIEYVSRYVDLKLNVGTGNYIRYIFVSTYIILESIVIFSNVRQYSF